jgi:hypothetical protein
MKYGIAYRLKVKNAERRADFTPNPQTVTAMIYDRSLLIADGEDTDITDLTGAEDPLRLSTIDNSEDKFTGIKALQATLSFKSTSTVNLATFADAAIPVGGTDPGDPRWEVVISIDNRVIFRGFLNIDDCSAPFMPHPETVTLTANDGLGTLKNKPLTDFEDITPRNYNKIIDYLCWALGKTGLSLNLNAWFNIRENNNRSKHIFEACYLWAKTFEDEIGTCENCYQVLEKILGEEAFLTQRNGEWWIVRVDDLGDETTPYISTFDHTGTLISETTQDLSKTIQRGTDIYFSKESTNVVLKRPHEFVKETYTFDYPREIVDNIDFSREDSEPYFTENFTEDGVDKVRKRYYVSDWNLFDTLTSSSTSKAKAYIERIFVDEYEKERYLVVERIVSGATLYELRSTNVPLASGDKFTIGVDYKYSENATGSGLFTVAIMDVRLAGDDGSYWRVNSGGPRAVVLGEQPTWVASSAGFPNSKYEYIFDTGPNTTDKTEWRSVSVDVPPLPVSGDIQICLMFEKNWGSEINYQNLQFNYRPLINGSYAKYTGLSHKVSREIDLTAVRDEQVKVSDGIRKLFKGALHAPAYIGLFSTEAIFFQFGDWYMISFTGNYLAVLSTVGAIRITDSNLNDGSYNIISTNYNGTYTICRVNKPVISETIEVNVDKIRFSLADEFYNYQVYPSTVPDSAIHTYAHIQAFDVWNQHRNTLRKFDFTAQGLTSGATDSLGGADLPHLMYRYTLGDTSDHTENRVFMLLNFDMDLRLCEWSGSLVEVYKTDVGKFYDDTDNLEIKYVQ